MLWNCGGVSVVRDRRESGDAIALEKWLPFQFRGIEKYVPTWMDEKNSATIFKACQMI